MHSTTPSLEGEVRRIRDAFTQLIVPNASLPAGTGSKALTSSSTVNDSHYYPSDASRRQTEIYVLVIPNGVGARFPASATDLAIAHLSRRKRAFRTDHPEHRRLFSTVTSFALGFIERRVGGPNKIFGVQARTRNDRGYA